LYGYSLVLVGILPVIRKEMVVRVFISEAKYTIYLCKME
jgi:hypothetical protein